jgi:hypothetical protein
MRVCESVSLRHSLVTKQMQSPNPQVGGKLIWSRVSPNRASSLGLIQILHSQEMPKSLQGEWPEMDEASSVICFPLCARKDDILPPPHSLHPFHLYLCLDIWQTREIGGS